MYEKGHEKFGGRAKGTSNKVNSEIKSIIKSILDCIDEDQIKKIEGLFRNKPETLLNFVAKIAPRDITLEDVTPEKQLDLSCLSDDELKQIKVLQEKIEKANNISNSNDDGTSSE